MSEVLYYLQQSLSPSEEPSVPLPKSLKIIHIQKELTLRIESLNIWKKTVNYCQSTVLEIKKITQEIDSLISCYSEYLKLRVFTRSQIEELEKLMNTFLHLTRPVGLERKLRIETYPRQVLKNTPKEDLTESLPNDFKYLLSAHTSIVFNGILTSNENCIIYSNMDSSIRFWDFSLNLTTKVLDGHRSSVNGLALTSDQKILASCSSDYLTHIWDLRSCEKIHKIRALKSPMLRVVISSNDKYLAISNSAGEVRIYALAEAIDRYAKTGAFFVWIVVIVETQGSVRSLAFTLDNTKVVASSKDHGILVRDMETGVSTELNVEGRDTIQETSDIKIFDSDHKMIAVGLQPNILVWDLKKMTLLYEMNSEDSERFSSVVVTKNNTLAYISGENRIIYELCLSSFDLRHKLKITENSINRLLLRNEDELITLGNHVTSFDIQSGQKKLEIRQSRNIELVNLKYINGHLLHMNSRNEISIVNLNNYNFEILPYTLRDPVKSVSISKSLGFCAVSDGQQILVYKNKHLEETN